jgi:uncharacterized protein
MKVILHLTRNCNLRCRYCYAASKGPGSMADQTARRAIDLAIRLGGRTACVSFFGGEPLLHFDRIRAWTEYALAAGSKANCKMHFRLSTNGTLFDEEKLAFCRDHQVLFAVSLDGDREAHNAQRVLADGTGSYDLLDSKLDLILRYHPQTIFTSVITPATVDRIHSSIESMWARGIRYFVHQLDYRHPDWTPAHLERLADSYRQAAGFYQAKLRAGERFHMGLFDDKIKTHAHSPFELGQICDFGAKKISIATDGSIYPCVQFISDKPDAQRFCIGHVDTGLTERRDELIRENRREREQCRGCAFNGRCTNYCGCVNWQLTGKITEVPGILCAHEQMLIPIADQIGNALWDEQDRSFLAKHYRDFEQRFPYSFD